MLLVYSDTIKILCKWKQDTAISFLYLVSKNSDN